MAGSVKASAQKNTQPVLQWKQIGQLPASKGQLQPLGFAGPVVGITNDLLLVAGGANFPEAMPWNGGKKKYYADVYLYRMEKDSLLLQPSTNHLPTAIAYAAVCSTPQGILYAGGENELGISKTVYLLNADAANHGIDIKQLPDLPLPLTNASATICNNIVYIAGGETIDGVSAALFCIHMNNTNDGWKILPAVPELVSHMVMLAMGQGTHANIYVCGGRKKNANGPGDLYNTLFAYHIATATWTQKKSLPYTLMAGTGIALDTHRLVLFGGDRGESFHQAEQLALAIANTADTVFKQQLMLKKNTLQANHPGFSKTILLYDALEDSWTTAGELQLPAQATTTAVVWNRRVIIPGGEIRAGVRTPAIAAAKLNVSGNGNQ